MKTKIEDLEIRIRKNELNRKSFWNPVGIFQNIPEVKKDGRWFKCSLKFTSKGTLQVTDLMIVDENSRVSEHTPGLYKEVSISNLKAKRMKIAMGTDKVNHKWFRIRKYLYARRVRINVFLLSGLLAVLYWVGNESYDNAWAQFIANNSPIQALLMLLTIFSVISVFYPMSVQKQFNEDDIRKIRKEEATKHDKAKEDEKRAKAMSTF